MEKFEEYLNERGIEIAEVEQFLANLDIHWDRSVPEGETFFELFPVSLSYKESKKVFEDYLCVDKFDFTLYREMEIPSKKNIDLTNKWIGFRLRRRPELFDEYKGTLESQLATAKQNRTIAREKVKKEYEKQRETLDRKYHQDMLATNYVTERLSNLLDIVEESNCEPEQ